MLIITGDILKVAVPVKDTQLLLTFWQMKTNQSHNQKAMERKCSSKFLIYFSELFIL